ncbi:MAG: CHASE2 domain-containing protein [Porticoccaceae bacterium]
MIAIKPNNALLTASLAVTAICLALTWRQPASNSFYGRISGLAYDLSLPQTAKKSEPRIVIVDIDEHSLASEGRWPWPREKTARLIESITAAGAAVVGLDILFPEPGEPEGDALLAQQLAQPNVVGAVAFALADDPLHAKPSHTSSPQNSQRREWLPSGMAGLSPSLNSADVALGHISPLYDADYVIRRIPPSICTNNCYDTLAIAMLSRWLGKNPEWRQTFFGNLFCVDRYCQRLNPDGSLSVAFHAASHFATLSATEILSTPNRIELLNDALVLVGTSAVGLGDRVSTPLSASTPGVEIHALALAASLNNIYWSQLPWSRTLVSILVLVTGLLAAGWPWLNRGGHLGGTATVALGVAATIALPQFGFWINALPFWAACLFTLLLISGREVFLALSQRRKIYRAFAAYVPPVVLRTLARQNLNPDKLDAQRADVTVFFADIQGFTALGEKLEPEQLIEITSHLFSGITEEIHRNKGTLDKFMGDAVMAFWGAPLPQKNHPELALDCALAVEKKLAQMAPWFEARGYPKIRMTMGLESGVVTVGNLGARQRRAYTIMGKSVNLASHLQQQCRQIGHDILCGPELCRRLAESGRIQLLPATIIRGLKEPQVIGYPAGDR